MQSCRYFGIELGVVEADYKFVTKFPYNVLPHPMILGQVVALFGVHVAPQVSRARPLLVPIHIALCVCGADVSPMNRGDAAAATWIFRGDQSWRRCGRDVEESGARLRYSRNSAAASTSFCSPRPRLCIFQTSR